MNDLEQDYGSNDVGYYASCDGDDDNEKIAARQFISKLVIMLKDYDVNKHRDVIEIDYYSNQIIKSKKEGK